MHSSDGSIRGAGQVKGKVNRVRKRLGEEWAKHIERQHNKSTTLVTYFVSIEQLNIYLQGSTQDLKPTYGKFEVYKPRQKKRNNKEV
jgi:hypothetical protein